MEFRSELTVALAKIIQTGRLTHAEIAKRAGTYMVLGFKSRSGSFVASVIDRT